MEDRDEKEVFVLRHDDHGLTQKQVSWVFEQCKGKRGFHVFVCPLPDEIGEVKSALYGPEVGDLPIGEKSVEYEKRGQRPGPSRLIGRPERAATNMVIVVNVEAESSVFFIHIEYTVFTAYGTTAERPTPREWWDASMKPHEAVEAAKFWSEHALARI